MPCERSDTLKSAYLSVAKAHDSGPSSPADQIDLVHLAAPSEVSSGIKSALQSLGWEVSEHFAPYKQIQSNNTMLIIDELCSPILPSITEDQWEALKNILGLGSRVLWVTAGSQLDVSSPNHAMIHGLARTIRAEDPSVSLTTLDVEISSRAETITAIDSILKSLKSPAPKTHIENEFAERHGILHISRIQPDHLINQAEKEDTHGADLVTKSLHESKTCIRLRCERLGTVDSLCYGEIAAGELPLRDNCVEVEIVTAGLNFKVCSPIWLYLRI